MRLPYGANYEPSSTRVDPLKQHVVGATWLILYSNGVVLVPNVTVMNVNVVPRDVKPQVSYIYYSLIVGGWGQYAERICHICHAIPTTH
jgi:xanthine/uracil permease